MPLQPECPVCGDPSPVRHCVLGTAGLRRVLFGNHVDLWVCPRCDELWCFSSHGEEVHEPVGIRWMFSTSDWQRAYDLDDGASLCRWHLRRVREEGSTIPHPCGRRSCRFARSHAARR